MQSYDFHPTPPHTFNTNLTDTHTNCIILSIFKNILKFFVIKICLDGD